LALLLKKTCHLPIKNYPYCLLKKKVFSFFRFNLSHFISIKFLMNLINLLWSLKIHATNISKIYQKYFFIFYFFNAKHGVNYAKRYFFLFLKWLVMMQIKTFALFFLLFYPFIFYFRPRCKFVGKQIKTFFSFVFFLPIYLTLVKKKCITNTSLHDSTYTIIP
jgi:hypothetical protein